jgi:hypothetical protein
MIDGGLPQRIVAETLVIVEIFLAAGDAKDPLGQQAALRMGDEVGVAGVRQGVVQGVEEAETAVGLTQEQGAGVGGEDAAREVRLKGAAFGTGKREGRRGTLCHRSGSWVGEDGLVLTPLSTNS